MLDGDGHLLPDATPPAADEGELLGIYEHMRFARRFDERSRSLQRGGRIATWAPMAGQEGAQVASACALASEDWLYPTYRDHAAKVVHGIDPADILRALAGHGEGYAVPDDVNVMPEYIPVATQVPQAMGAAWAAKLKGEDRAYLCYMGDGATSEGDFHEGLNFAGVFDVPAVFFCNNNGWAISTPNERQTKSETLAGKAAAYGIEGVRVDGMDPLAVYRVTRRAIEKAKQPGADERRPTLIEAEQYRFGPHTTADDHTRYRDDPDDGRELDPIPRLETYLREQGVLDDDLVETIEERVEHGVQDAIERAEATEPADPSALFEHVYEEPTPQLRRQQQDLERLRERYGDAAVRGEEL